MVGILDRYFKKFFYLVLFLFLINCSASDNVNEFVKNLKSVFKDEIDTSYLSEFQADIIFCKKNQIQFPNAYTALTSQFASVKRLFDNGNLKRFVGEAKKFLNSNQVVTDDNIRKVLELYLKIPPGFFSEISIRLSLLIFSYFKTRQIKISDSIDNYLSFIFNNLNEDVFLTFAKARNFSSTIYVFIKNLNLLYSNKNESFFDAGSVSEILFALYLFNRGIKIKAFNAVLRHSSGTSAFRAEFDILSDNGIFEVKATDKVMLDSKNQLIREYLTNKKVRNKDDFFIYTILSNRTFNFSDVKCYNIVQLKADEVQSGDVQLRDNLYLIPADQFVTARDQQSKPDLDLQLNSQYLGSELNLQSQSTPSVGQVESDQFESDSDNESDLSELRIDRESRDEAVAPGVLPQDSPVNLTSTETFAQPEFSGLKLERQGRLEVGQLNKQISYTNLPKAKKISDLRIGISNSDYLFKVTYDGKYAIYQSSINKDYYVFIVDLENDYTIQIPSESQIESIDVSPDSRYVTYFDKNVKVVDLLNKTIVELPSSDAAFKNVVISSDSRYLITAMNLRTDLIPLKQLSFINTVIKKKSDIPFTFDRPMRDSSERLILDSFKKPIYKTVTEKVDYIVDNSFVYALFVMNLQDLSCKLIYPPFEDNQFISTFAQSNILSVPNNNIITYLRSKKEMSRGRSWFRSGQDEFVFLDLNNSQYSVYSCPSVNNLDLGVQGFLLYNDRFFVFQDTVQKKLLILNNSSIKKLSLDVGKGAFCLNSSLIVTLNNKLAIIDLSTGKIVAETPGKYNYQNLVVSPDGMYAITVNMLKSGLAVINLKTFEVSYKNTYGDFAYQQLQISADGEYLFTVNKKLQMNNLIKIKLSELLGTKQTVQMLPVLSTELEEPSTLPELTPMSKPPTAQSESVGESESYSLSDDATDEFVPPEYNYNLLGTLSGDKPINAYQRDAMLEQLDAAELAASSSELELSPTPTKEPDQVSVASELSDDEEYVSSEYDDPSFYYDEPDDSDVEQIDESAELEPVQQNVFTSDWADM